jgi:hypothetical protein
MLRARVRVRGKLRARLIARLYVAVQWAYEMHNTCLAARYAVEIRVRSLCYSKVICTRVHTCASAIFS